MAAVQVDSADRSAVRVPSVSRPQIGCMNALTWPPNPSLSSKAEPASVRNHNRSLFLPPIVENHLVSVELLVTIARSPDSSAGCGDVTSTIPGGFYGEIISRTRAPLSHNSPYLFLDFTTNGDQRLTIHLTFLTSGV
ncbi:hypothetical protein TNCV_2383471 [Trichonephila clavipes]|nr:hypothetical protein TNCV_2383471 [Trichonephila clavipes]